MNTAFYYGMYNIETHCCESVIARLGLNDSRNGFPLHLNMLEHRKWNLPYTMSLDFRSFTSSEMVEVKCFFRCDNISSIPSLTFLDMMKRKIYFCHDNVHASENLKRTSLNHFSL